MAEPKKCPHCGAEMKREPPSLWLWQRLSYRMPTSQREKSEPATFIDDDDMWVCPKCQRSEDPS